MPGFSSLFQETHRRAVWQVLGTYVAGAWVVLQVVEVLMETVGLPDWVPRFALILLLMGLPMVLATAVIQGAARSRAARRAEALEEGPVPEDSTAHEGDVESGTRSVFTWRNMMYVGVAGFALLGVVTAAWMSMRALGVGPVGSLVASGAIEEGGRIVLAELDGDPALANGATLALRVDLDESELISTMDPAYVSSVLALMQRPADSRLDAALAREVAIRSGAKAVLEGEITPVGSSQVLTVRLVAAESGEQLAAFRETAKDADGILEAIDRLSRKLRERLGESLRAIHASEPLADVTTASLGALQKYSQGWAAINAGNDAQGIALLEDAVALDSTFAMAWRKLSTVTFGDRRVEAATRAYELRDRLTDRERYHTLGTYHTAVSGDTDQAVTAYRTLLASYPDDAVALNNLGVAYGSRGEDRLAAEMYARAMEVDRLSATYPQNLIYTLYGQGRTDSAGVVLDRYEANLPDHAELPTLVFRYATARGDYPRAWGALEKRLADEDLDRRRFARLGEGWLTLIEGRLSEAETIWEQLTADDAPEDRLERALERAAELDLRVLGDTAAAVRAGAAALERYDFRDRPAPEWPIDDVLFLFGEAGRPDLARPLITEWVGLMEEVNPSLVGVVGPMVLGYLDAQAALRGSDPASAMPDLRRFISAAVENGNCDSLCAVEKIATGYDLAGQADSAIVWYERYLALPELDRIDEDAQHLHRVLLRLGQLNDEVGRLGEARLYYGRFEELWRNADPRLAPRVDAVRVRLGELLEQSG